MQTYYASSAWSDPSNIANAVTAIVAVLALPETAAVVPSHWAPYLLFIIAVLNVVLRTFFVVRPVANIAPGESTPTTVRTI